MSIFGYPASVVHFHSGKDEWGFPYPAIPIEKNAKVVEEQKLIKNARGEEIQVAYEIHLEGVNAISFDDRIEYVNALCEKVTVLVAHYEVRKFLGTDDVKKVVVYG
jgi:hypothetical protein